MFGTDKFVIKPKDFTDQVTKTDGVKESLSVWRRKRLQKGKNIIPREPKTCESCIYCQQSGSIYRCTNPNSKYYGMDVDSTVSCVFYLTDMF